jgi:hypothetical protein
MLQEYAADVALQPAAAAAAGGGGVQVQLIGADGITQVLAAAAAATAAV